MMMENLNALTQTVEIPLYAVLLLYSYSGEKARTILERARRSKTDANETPARN